MERSNDCLHTLWIVGTALMITPIIAALPSFLMAMLSDGIYPGPGKPVLSQEFGVASHLIITAGFIIIFYVSVKKFKEGYKESIEGE